MLSDVQTTDSTTDVVASDFANNYIALIAFTLLVYDYLLTLTPEVTLYWTVERLSWSTFMFFLNRYFTLLGSTPVMIEVFWSGPPSEPAKIAICHHLQRYHMYFATGVQLFVSVILIMRTYALYGGNRVVLMILLLFMGGILGLAAWGAAASKGQLSDIPISNDTLKTIGCQTGLGRDSARVITAVWIGMLALDVTVFGLTLQKALKYKRYKPKVLFTVLIRDGSMYFAIIAAANLGNILSFYLGSDRIRGVGTPFVNSISSLMISRLMLNLRDPLLTIADNSTQTGPPDLSLPSSERENTYPLSYITEWYPDSSTIDL